MIEYFLQVCLWVQYELSMHLCVVPPGNSHMFPLFSSLGVRQLCVLTAETVHYITISSTVYSADNSSDWNSLSLTLAHPVRDELHSIDSVVVSL